MLVLSRKLGEEIVVNGNIVITIVRFQGDKVRIWITAPDDVPVYRSELLPLNGTQNNESKKVVSKVS